MVRLADIPEVDRAHLLAKRCPRLPGTAWTSPRPLAKSRVALVTTAGIGLRSQGSFDFGDLAYRVIPDNTPAAEIVMSHVSVNYDRSGFQEDLNVVFPLDRLRELVDNATLGSMASYHYSFMGALNEPESYEATARDVARLMRDDGVDTAFLTPV